MFWLLSLLVLEAILEGYLCGGYISSSRIRKPIAVFTGLLLVTMTVFLCVANWQIWIWGIPMVGYRLINLLRVYVYRLPPARLRTVAIRAFGWLLGVQIVVSLIAWQVSANELGSYLFNIVIGLQLVGSLVLLRATADTWQHALVSEDPEVLTDNQLPAISVLVPARNETDDLERCLEALVASDYPKLEIIVYDDCSANRRTPEIIRSFAHSGVRFVQGDVPDETRWLAKNYAYKRLSDEASGEILVFCGVDALIAPHSLRRIVCLFQERNRDMLSVMPLRDAQASRGGSLLQAMRYYWEICLPRRFFKRPPVLSTCWMIRKTSLLQMGGFESVSKSVTPEAPFAKRAVANDTYSFIRSDASLGIVSNKSEIEQYSTSIRVRYPQLHRRLELVGLAAIFEILLFITPMVGLLGVAWLSHGIAYGLAWLVTVLSLLTTYATVTVGARLTSPWYGWLLMPIAFGLDIVILHVSMWKYEFTSVEWKGRNVCIPVMHLLPTENDKITLR